MDVLVIMLNVVNFALMGMDKLSARKGGQRVPEKLILLLALTGGSAGAWLGMKLFRHKTRHRSFALGLPLVISVQVILLLYLSLRPN